MGQPTPTPLPDTGPTGLVPDAPRVVPVGHPEPVVLRNRAATGEEPWAPIMKSDGSLFRHLVGFSDDRWHAYADTYRGCVEALTGVRGYRNLSEDQADFERIRWTLHQAVILQAQIIAAAERSGAWSSVTEAERHVLGSVGLVAPSGFTAGGVGAGCLGADVWTARVPLVLVATAYQPFGGADMPEGNVIVLDPSDDERLLITLHDAGVIRWMIAD